MSFKDQAAQDINRVFFNTDEFSDNVTIDGQPQIVNIDDDALKERANIEYGGITTGMILYFIPVTAFPAKPSVGDTQLFNDKYRFIESVSEADGVYEILLNQNRGE